MTHWTRDTDEAGRARHYYTHRLTITQGGDDHWRAVMVIDGKNRVIGTGPTAAAAAARLKERLYNLYRDARQSIDALGKF